MQRTERRGILSYEDVMKELEAFEHELLPENRAMAMELMVLEAKIRERFQQMENRLWDRYTTFDLGDSNPAEAELSMAEIEAMIPHDLFPQTMEQVSAQIRRRRALRAVGVAAALAIGTAAVVFGLASLLQIALTWI